MRVLAEEMKNAAAKVIMLHWRDYEKLADFARRDAAVVVRNYPRRTKGLFGRCERPRHFPI
jgi:hypothetical protein